MSKIISPIGWGGDDEMESLHDVLAMIKRAVPSAKFTKTEFTSGGWPNYEIEFDPVEAWDLGEVLGLDQTEMLEMMEN